MKKAILILAIFAAGFCFADTTWVSDTVSGVWDSTGNPYIFTENCVVAESCSLYITEGVRIIKADSIEKTLANEGRLVLEGSSDFPVYITGVRLDFPDSLDYCIVESTGTGIYGPSVILHTLIRYCETGINSSPRGAYFCYMDISCCSLGVFIDAAAFTMKKGFIHNNIIGFNAKADIDGWPVVKGRFYYCTFVGNEFSYWGEAYYNMWDDHCYTEANYYDCLVCDPRGGSGYAPISNSYYPNISEDYYSRYQFAEYHNLEPEFIDTAAGDYRLAPTSPYIDMGGTASPDTFYGLAPDLGAFESPYTNSFAWIKSLSDGIDYPSTEFGDTSISYVRVKNFGSVSPDSIIFRLDPPFFVSSVSDSSFTPHEDIRIYIGCNPLSCLNYEDTLEVHWFYDSYDSTLLFPLNTGTALSAGAISGTLYVECSPYLLGDSIYVPEGETLFIEPGVRLRYTDSTWPCVVWPFQVYGTLIALGEEDAIIQFGHKVDVLLLSSADTSRFRYCDFYALNVAGNQALANFNNCAFRNTDNAFNFGDSSYVTFDSCQIRDNFGGSAAGYIKNSNAVFNFCEFRDNMLEAYCETWHCGICLDWWAEGGIMNIRESYVSFNSCIFIDNATDPRAIHCCNPVDGFNDWYDYYPTSSIIEARNSVFVGNNTGFDLAINCTFIRVNRGDYDALNCIFLQSSGFPNCYNCLVPSGVTADSSSVFFGTPTFVSDTSYMLTPTSIGVDMGADFAVTDSGDTIWAPTTDFYGNPRPSGTGFDIGAAEYQWESYTPIIDCYTGWNLVSNPLTGTYFMTELLDSIDSPLIGYNSETGGYYYETILRQGNGYWVLISDDVTTEISADLLDSVTIDLYRGWNLIGGVGGPVEISSFGSSGFIVPPIFGFDAVSGDYFATSVLLPWRGYWVLSERDTTITIHR